MVFIPIISSAAEFFLGSTVTAAVTAAAADVGLASAAAATLVPGVTVASAVSGAIIGSGTAALTAAATGGDIAKAAENAAVSSVVGQVAGAEIGQALGGGAASPTASPDYPGTAVGAPTVPTVGGMPELGSTVVGAASQGAGTTAAALASGQPLSSALQAGLRGAELGGIGGLATGLAKYDFGADAGTAGEIGTAAKSLAGYALPSISGASTPSYTPSVQPGLSLQGPATPAPSPTLGQSLSIAPTLGYTPTGTVFGSSDDSGQKSNVWNVGSLRNIGSAES